jgi:uncharacterized protein with HEPN domain
MSSGPTRWKFRLRHMQEAVDKILRFSQGVDEATFRADEKLVDAVVWNLVVLGEAAKFIPDPVVQVCPEVPWPQIRGIRNRIVHGYDQINLSIIWNVVEVELPPLVPHLERMMNEAVE